ncbi:MAG: choice-of-anchor Q domain-containing protein, partial [Planctomycetia bacterium]
FTFINSTLSGNTAIFGGGVFNDGGGILNFSNSTVSGNSAGQGGGIANNSGTVTVTNSTVSGNSADQNGGGGIANNGTLNIANSIVANSTSGGDYAGQVGTIGTNTNNLVEDGSLPGTSEITGDPLLGPLQNNGGPTFTQALLSGSPAIGAGSGTISNASPVSRKDQRGFVRTTSDIGAYSYNFASAGDALVSLDNSNQVVLTLSSSGATLSDVHTSFNSVNNTLTITAATSGNLIASPSGGIAGVTIDNVSAANTITLDLNTLANFAGLVIVGNSGLDSVTIGTGGVDLSAVATGAANVSFTANILGTSNSTSALALSNAIKTKGTNASTYLSAGTINGSGLITTPIITLAALSGIGATT